MKLHHLLGGTLCTAVALSAALLGKPAWSGKPAAALPAAGLRDRIDFTLPDMNGNPVSLGTFLGKKPVLLVFWATWCPSCNEAVPAINRIHAESGGGERLQILALDYKESKAKVASFVRNKQVAYPVLLDKRGTVARKLRILGIPTYILIDAAGRTAFRGYEPPDPSRYLGSPPAR